jgi:hypothetical protein
MAVLPEIRRPGLLCKVSEKFLRRVLKPSIHFILSLFIEHFVL